MRTTLVDAAEKYDEKRKVGELAWSPQFRELESLHVISERVGERIALSMFVSGLCEQVDTGKLAVEDAVAACRMLDEGGCSPYRVAKKSRVPAFEGYPRAVTR